MLAQTLTQQSPAPLAWLWPRYLPLARLTLLAADPGVGKTALALDLAARLSTACPMPPIPSTPDPSRSPAASLFITPDPAPGDLLHPRLDHANPDLIHTLSVPPNPASLFDALNQNLPRLQASAPLKLLIIDPITAYLPLITPDAPLYRLADLARQFNLAILLTTRLAKNFALSPSHLRRSLGSLAFASAARCAHILLPARSARFLEPKNTPQSSPPPLPNGPSPIASPLIALIPAKSNCGPLPPPLSFSLSAFLRWHTEPFDHACLRNDPVTEHAEQFLIAFLSNGPQSATSVLDAAAKNAIPRITLTRAKSNLNIHSSRLAPPNTGALAAPRWYWLLPNESRPIPPDLPSASDTSLSQIMSLLTKP